VASLPASALAPVPSAGALVHVLFFLSVPWVQGLVIHLLVSYGIIHKGHMPYEVLYTGGCHRATYPHLCCRSAWNRALCLALRLSSAVAWHPTWALASLPRTPCALLTLLFSSHSRLLFPPSMRGCFVSGF